jgi:hypothetical protein
MVGVRRGREGEGRVPVGDSRGSHGVWMLGLFLLSQLEGPKPLMYMQGGTTHTTMFGADLRGRCRCRQEPLREVRERAAGRVDRARPPEAQGEPSCPPFSPGVGGRVASSTRPVGDLDEVHHVTEVGWSGAQPQAKQPQAKRVDQLQAKRVDQPQARRVEKAATPKKAPKRQSTDSIISDKVGGKRRKVGPSWDGSVPLSSGPPALAQGHRLEGL